MMVFIHGGGFIHGESSFYGPEHLLDRDVILVTLNYRLGPFGFLNLGVEVGDEEFEEGMLPSGNQGLWDQRLGRYGYKDLLEHNILAPDNPQP